MIVLLKMYVSGRIFDKICLKIIKDAFSPIYGLWSGRKETQCFGGGDIQQKGRFQTF